MTKGDTSMKSVWMIFGLFICLVVMAIAVPKLPVQAQTGFITTTFVPTRTPAPTAPPFKDYQAIVEDGLQGIVRVQHIDVQDHRPEKNGARTITITYASQAATPKDLIGEWFQILDPLGQTIQVQHLDIDEIALLGQDSALVLVGRFTTNTKD